MLIALLRQAERGDRLDELEKIGAPADSRARQNEPLLSGVGLPYELQSQGPHRFEEY